MSLISKGLLRGAEVLRPVLVKLIPGKALSAIKARVIGREAKEIGGISIAPYKAGVYPKGVNLIGDIRVDTGLGESMRYVSSVLDAAGIPNLIYNYYVPPGMNMSDHSCDGKICDQLKYEINIFHINASEMAVAYMDLGREFFDGHYNIGFWLWELEEFPEEWLPALNLIDELWVPSDFEKHIFEKITDKPVATIPYPVADKVSASIEKPTSARKVGVGIEKATSADKVSTSTEKPASADKVSAVTAEPPSPHKEDEKSGTRANLSLPADKFLFLMMYDGGSGAARKNPAKVIESFKQAFAPDEDGVGLVVKLKSGSESDIEYIRGLMDGRTNVYFIAKDMERSEVNALISCVDVYVSLHRAEGFGLVCAEAMALGTPVIATAWSATTDFMNEECACMTDYEMIELDKDYPPFKKGYHWAEADSDSAAKYMRKLFEDKGFYDIIRSNAYKYVHEKLSMERAAGALRQRLDEIMR